MIFRSRYPDVEIPEVPLHEFVLNEAEARGPMTAFIDSTTGRSITFAQLAHGVDRVAAGLARRGFGVGDVFAIFSPNIPEYAVAFFGVSRAGGTNTTVNPTYTAEELNYQLRDAKARFLLTVSALLPRAIEAAHGTAVEEIFVFDPQPDTAGATPFAQLLVGNDPAPVVTLDVRKHVVALPYSSGTTGLPKGVMLTHYNLVANLSQIAFIDKGEPGDTTIAVLPFFHIYGLTVIMMSTLRLGMRIVTMPRFELESFLRALQDYSVRSVFIVPPIMLALAKHPLVGEFDLSSIRQISSGAAPMSPELEIAVGKRLNTIVKQGYGMTETSPVTHFIPEDPSMLRPGSAGLLIPNTEVRIVDPQTGVDVPEGEQGELLIRGPQVMMGYLNNPEATAQALTPDGWLHTGDMGRVDADGYFYIVDRLKEFIKHNAYQVAPAELEGVLLKHPAIADAAVIPVPDEASGEIPKAFVVARSPVSADEVMAHVAAQVAPYKKVREVEFVDAIPKSPSGKILRRVLIEQERAKRVTA